MKLLGKHYYSNPIPEHCTGDIWMNLPSFGLLKSTNCSGIVITPACDLANDKVETVTYLPIIPIQQWFCSRSLYQIVRSELFVLFRQNSIDINETLFNKNFMPKQEYILYLISDINAKKPYIKQSQLDSFERMLIGLDLMHKITNPSVLRFDTNQLGSFIGEKKYSELKEKILRNSFSNDIHYFPKDNENIEWSAISDHSVVLFRYPITTPIEVFDLASDYNCLNWELSIKELSMRFPTVHHFESIRPIKSLHLNQEFLSDLLTRYISLYIRLGSPDFSNDTINQFNKEIQ